MQSAWRLNRCDVKSRALMRNGGTSTRVWGTPYHFYVSSDVLQVAWRSSDSNTGGALIPVYIGIPAAALGVPSV